MTTTIGTPSFYFTVPEIMAQKYSLCHAAVYSKICRLWHVFGDNMNVTHEVMATELGLERRTIIRAIPILIKDGFIVDRNPGLRNKPHAYAPTKKLVFIPGDMYYLDETERDEWEI